MWSINRQLIHSASVNDKDLGLLLFPENDTVMLPTIAQQGVWEPEEIGFIQKFVISGMHCINVGANVGYHSKHLSRKIGQSGTVYCFEPNPQVFQYLRFNLTQEEFRNWKLYKFAIGSKLESRLLYLNESNYVDSRLFDPRLIKETVPNENLGFYGKIKTKRVHIKTLDSIFLKDNKKIDFILSDAQGWDLHVILGALGLIERDYPIILFEYVPGWIQSLGDDQHMIFTTLRNLQYEFFRLDSGELSPLGVGSEVEELDGSKRWYSNIICIHNSAVKI